ncbi:MAG TPA: coenzyme F420-0:L-glutamate ligase [Terriglobales bacterium]|nr:coenzyme F420-0:L-glutamate ligase [Terriglobales bacterium]
MPEIRAIPLEGVGEVRPGVDISELVLQATRKKRQKLQPGDILIITHKVVSKAEGQIIPLSSVKPSPATQRWAKKFKLDARVVQLGLNESRRIVRRRNGITIAETRHGFVCANAGVDASNVDGGQSAVLLPRDPDGSARQIHRRIKSRVGFSVPVILTDSFGRPWREGLTEVAIGVAGMKPLRDYRGQRDAHGYRLRVTVDAIADELACMAGLACGKLSRAPACIIRGYPYQRGRGSGRDLIRPAKRDLFR